MSLPKRFLPPVLFLVALLGGSPSHAFIVSDLNKAGRHTYVEYAWWIERDELRRALYVEGFAPEVYQGDYESVSLNEFILQFRIFSPQMVIALAQGGERESNLSLGAQASKLLLDQFKDSATGPELRFLAELSKAFDEQSGAVKNLRSVEATRHFVEFLRQLSSSRPYQPEMASASTSVVGYVRAGYAHFNSLVSVKPTKCLRVDPTGRFLSTPAGCKDNKTKLTYSGSITGVSSVDIGFWTRESAEAYCKLYNKGAALGWRLPTVDELKKFAGSYAAHFVPVLSDAVYWAREADLRREKLRSEYQEKDQPIGTYEVLVDSGWGFRKFEIVPRLGTLHHALDVEYDADVETLVHIDTGKVFELKKHRLKSTKETISVIPKDEGPRESPGPNGRLTTRSGPRRVVGPTYEGEVRENLAWGLRVLPADVLKFQIGLLCVLEEK